MWARLMRLGVAITAANAENPRERAEGALLGQECTITPRRLWGEGRAVVPLARGLPYSPSYHDTNMNKEMPSPTANVVAGHVDVGHDTVPPPAGGCVAGMLILDAVAGSAEGGAPILRRCSHHTLGGKRVSPQHHHGCIRDHSEERASTYIDAGVRVPTMASDAGWVAPQGNANRSGTTVATVRAPFPCGNPSSPPPKSRHIHIHSASINSRISATGLASR